MRDFIIGIKNLIYWFPIVWKLKLWDYTSLLLVIEHQLKAQSKYTELTNRHTTALQEARQMRICYLLSEKLRTEFYPLEHFDYLETKIDFIPVEGSDSYEMKTETLLDNLDEYFAKYPRIYKQVSKETTDRERIALRIGRINEQRAKRLMFKIMSDNILSWWD